MVDDPKELETSTDSETQDELGLETEQEAPTSSADSETEEDLLSVVQSAIEGEETEEAESQSVEVEEGDFDEEEAEPLAASEDEDDDGEVSDRGPVPYDRFQKVISQKNEFKEGHRQYQQITNYLAENNINSEEASTGLQIMALMKNDPQRALEALTPYIETLRQITGDTMPDDIRERVDDGYMDEDAGRELARARAEANRLRQTNERVQEQQVQAQSAQHLEGLAQTVTSWEMQTRQQDPDFDLRQDEIDDRVRVLVAERGRPETAEAAIAMANEAYKTVNDRFKQRTVTRKPMKTASGGKLGGTPTPEPNSLLEAVRNAMAQGST